MSASALRLSVVVALISTGSPSPSERRPAGGWRGVGLLGRELVDALLGLLLVLPPTVTGYYLLVVLGRNGPSGGFTIPFTLAACVVAATVMAFPLVVRAARASRSEEIDPRQRLAAASLGLSSSATLRRVELPPARRGPAAGAALRICTRLGRTRRDVDAGGKHPWPHADPASRDLRSRR